MYFVLYWEQECFEFVPCGVRYHVYEYVVITCVNQFAIEPLHAILPAKKFEKMC